MTSKVLDPNHGARPPSQRERNRARTRADIVAAAVDLFEAQGYLSTTVEQIAKAAGSSSATFFRHFASKEDVLFANDTEAAAELQRFVSERTDRSVTLASLAEPVASYAKVFLTETTTDAQRMTRLVMTTRELEARSMRMRLLWEHAITRQLTQEHPEPSTGIDHPLLAALAVSCLATALWEWQRPHSNTDIHTAAMQAFARAQYLILPN